MQTSAMPQALGTNPPMPASLALWRAMIDGCNLLCCLAPGYEAHLLPDSALILSGEPHADMNFAFVGNASDAIQHLRTFHERASVRELPLMLLSTEAAAPRIIDLASSMGFVAAGGVPFMTCRDLHPSLSSHPYLVERIENTLMLSKAVPLIARTFGLPAPAVARIYNPETLALPGVDYFIACREGEIWSSVQTTRIGTQVGIWSMATPPEYQRQGAGRALLQAVLDHHRQRGADLFYLISSSAGHALYQRLGFQDTGRLSAWIIGTSTQLGTSAAA